MSRSAPTRQRFPAFDPAVAVVEKFDQQVEHVHGFCGTVGVARHDCGS
jgi:hypothetical protein